MAYSIRIDDFSQQEWESAARDFCDYTIYQTWPYQQVRAEMENQSISRAILQDSDQRTVAMFQVRIKKLPFPGFRVGYVQRGPLLRRRDGLSVSESDVFDLIRDSYLNKKVDILRLVPNIPDDEYGKHVAQCLLKSRFDCVKNAPVYQTFIMPVSEGEDAILERMDRSWRRSLKKARRDEHEIVEDTSLKAFEIVTAIYDQTKRRKGFVGVNPEIFIKTQERLSPSEKIPVIVVYKNAVPVTVHASSFLGRIGEGIIAASTEEGLASGASYIAWWKTLQAACSNGMHSYDLGGIDPVKNPSVYLFKKRMGADESRLIGTFDAVSGPVKKGIFYSLENLYRFLVKFK